MVQNKIRWLYSLIVIICLFALNLQAKPVMADEGTETAIPTQTLEATPTLATTEPTISVSTSELITPSSAVTALTQASPTSSPIVVPTFTPGPLLKGNYLSNEILVRFKNPSDEEIAFCLNQVNGQIDAIIEEINFFVVKIHSIDVSNAITILSKCEHVRTVEPNYLVVSLDTIPSDSGWGNQYGLINIRAPQGWDLSRGSSNIVIAVVDSGVDLSHPDLASKIVAGYDFVNNDAIAQDDNGHGTHVAGIAAAVSNNGTGVAGVSWGARIMPVKVLNAGGGGTFGDVVAGIVWAADNGAHIINLSVGGTTPSLALENAVNYAVNNGVIVVAASGNDGANFIRYPAAYPNAIAVGATDSSNNLAGLSNFAAEIDLVAPGVSIYSTTNGGAYTFRNGTSMSTAFVAGLAAILRGIPGNSASSVRSIMESTALDLGPAGWDAFYGNGLIQMDTAVQMALPNYTPTPPANEQTPLIFGSGGYISTLTFTPNVTITSTIAVTLTQWQTPTLTFQPIENGIVNNTPTPEIIALGTQATEATGVYGRWIVPSCGIILIIVGLILFWLMSRRKRRSYSGIYF